MASATWPVDNWMGHYDLKRKYNCSKPSSPIVQTAKAETVSESSLNGASDKSKLDVKSTSIDGGKVDFSVLSTFQSTTNALIHGSVKNKNQITEIRIAGKPASLDDDGSFDMRVYVPRSGVSVEVAVSLVDGSKVSKILELQRGELTSTSGPVFAALDPSSRSALENKDALALIVGVADYQRTPAKAAYADKDAQTFYDYAMLKLGIPAGNIKELVNNSAGEVDMRLAVKDWIARSTKEGQSDIYVFFAGHGLANQSGKKMYLLPYDGSPRLLEDSAISRERLFADISAANPRSVTVFLDTCYSGTTRGTDMLIASRPIAIRALEQSIPDNFTVMTAAAGDQTAKPLEEAKHGMFSYFLMKGMEGEADANNDNQITAGELHSYVQTNVIQQSSGSQTPELQGDAERVLVRFQ
ncbi:caspase family protein [Alphaproteobacteria bacterium]|nr:caspase family protein [Alphaproteobacteria bacterium]